MSDIIRLPEDEIALLLNKPFRTARQDVRSLPTYTIPEAAAMLAVNRWTLADWYEEPRPLLKASGTYLNKGNIRLLSFRDLEEVYKVHLLRTVHGKSMQYLQSALVDARKLTRSEHPLLDFQILVFKHLGLDMPPKGRQPRKMIPLGSSTQMSLYIPDVIETWGKRIVQDSEGKGQQIFPWKESSTDEVSRPVSINANVLSGRLVVTGTRIPVQVLMGYYESGRSIEKIAQLYKLDVDTVRKAIHHSEPEQQKAS